MVPDRCASRSESARRALGAVVERIGELAMRFAVAVVHARAPGVLAAGRAPTVDARQASAISAGIPLKHRLEHKRSEIEIPIGSLSRIDFANSGHCQISR